MHAAFWLHAFTVYIYTACVYTHLQHSLYWPSSISLSPWSVKPGQQVGSRRMQHLYSYTAYQKLIMIMQWYSDWLIGRVSAVWFFVRFNKKYRIGASGYNYTYGSVSRWWRCKIFSHLSNMCYIHIKIYSNKCLSHAMHACTIFCICDWTALQYCSIIRRIFYDTYFSCNGIYKYINYHRWAQKVRYTAACMIVTIYLRQGLLLQDVILPLRQTLQNTLMYNRLTHALYHELHRSLNFSPTL